MSLEIHFGADWQRSEGSKNLTEAEFDVCIHRSLRRDTIRIFYLIGLTYLTFMLFLRKFLKLPLKEFCDRIILIQL
jgi:hypothetical protein